MKRTVDMTPQEAIETGHDHRYRLWDGERMHYESDVFASLKASKRANHVHPDGKLGKDKVIMWITAWKDGAETDIYEGDVVRDCDGYSGVIVFWREECCFAVSYPKRECQKPEMLAMAEFCPSDLRVIGNIYEHPDWANWPDSE